jgi:hypothetical protein
MPRFSCDFRVARHLITSALATTFVVTGSLLALPLFTATPAAAQDFPEEYDWPSNLSKITKVKMPPHTSRLASGATAYPKGVVEKMIANGKAAGMQVDRREEFFWYSQPSAQLQAERNIFHKNLTAAGYTVKMLGEADFPDEHVIYFVAQKKGAPTGNGTVPGFWSVGKEFQALVLGAAAGVLGPKVVPKVYTAKEQLGFDLIAAVEAKNPEQVKAMLAKGADVNARSKYKQTPLMRAVMNDRPDIAEILLNAGADPNLGTTDLNPLMIATMGEQMALLDMLVAHKANVNFATEESGTTSLHLAALLGKTRAAEFLLENGADIALRDQRGRSARDVALQNKHNDIAAKIAEKG